MVNKPILAITPGEPAGIGPDLCLQLLQRPLPCPVVVIADPDMLQQRAEILGLAFDYTPWTSHHRRDRAYYVAEVSLPGPTVAGKLDPNHAQYVLQTLQRAASGCLSGEFSGLVTGPVHKGNINDAGFPFSGHTEYLANLGNSQQVVMMLADDHMRVALATTHIPLSKVSNSINQELLISVLRVLDQGLKQQFAIPQPRILVCGLNPHAGESGHLGNEEMMVIAPAIQILQQEGLRLTGPVSADTAFLQQALRNTDAILAMYHDQGLPVIKHGGFGNIVNITLGLPFIRTSVDHGTALSLAGSGNIDSGSMQSALDMAYRLTQHDTAQTA
ncbi:MAG TPA: 4-hydroxythreonine-4-phosphate dehydrogenase PdxA [Acidiferrobacteraceae bacterium]|nr:4-hydroxythreonine-4-phosphate dehydrogenase PdxA [Acidiferrobacteraceae bacterium]HEX20634.1 4-hydroxythreonine-4-phosphate dehydrogenase PdxA [Acidiferrobacteraceae bacterium]